MEIFPISRNFHQSLKYFSPPKVLRHMPSSQFPPIRAIGTAPAMHVASKHPVRSDISAGLKKGVSHMIRTHIESAKSLVIASFATLYIGVMLASLSGSNGAQIGQLII
jgi:hypothetical protein